MGQLLRGSNPWTYRREGPARPARLPSARRERRNSRLRRGHKRLAPMRRGVQPRARVLLHPSRHSAGQPIVAGWAYQFVAQLNFVRKSSTAPVDVERLRPAQDANVVTSEQVSSFLRRSLPSRKTDAAPLFVFDAGYDPVKVQQARRMSLPDPPPFASGAAPLRQPESLGSARTRRTPSSPRAQDEVLRARHLAQPSAEHTCEDAGYGSVRVRAWAEMHPKVSNHAGKGTRGPLPSWSGR